MEVICYLNELHFSNPFLISYKLPSSTTIHLTGWRESQWSMSRLSNFLCPVFLLTALTFSVIIKLPAFTLFFYFYTCSSKLDLYLNKYRKAICELDLSPTIEVKVSIDYIMHCKNSPPQNKPHVSEA